MDVWFNVCWVPIFRLEDMPKIKPRKWRLKKCTHPIIYILDWMKLDMDEICLLCGKCSQHQFFYYGPDVTYPIERNYSGQLTVAEKSTGRLTQIAKGLLSLSYKT